ncbi:unnamed protein product [Knipowitschia caucasica]|uniref:polynucleotide adenylyltransferase n=1 Tax=Knipowitschia caucasica TaxID=637954 RepID=A0AAV2MRP0_KNICA
MFPRKRGPRDHQVYYNGVPPVSSRSDFHKQTQHTNVNTYNGPGILPVYQWNPKPIPIYPASPQVTNSRKRQYSHGSPAVHHVKRQRVESFHTDDFNPSFESPPLPQTHLPVIAKVSHDTTSNKPRIPSHRLLAESPETPISLRVDANDKMSAQMVELFEACQQQTSDLLKKEGYRARLQKDIQRLYPDGRLYLTGSTMSGLGCRSSDADLCLVIKLKQTNVKVIDVLFAVLRLLRNLDYVDRVLLIRAKVPILRFKERGSNLEFDLNVNNTVGIRNTFLLRSYTNADIRIRPFMLVVKKWARHYEINDASKGTLSSYALALMALNYLQLVKPPVLPSLQKDHPTYFDSCLDLDMVPDGSQRVPCYRSKNKSSLGELFLGFLEYYALTFRWDSQIISVREGRTLPKTSGWMGKFINVEEPFEGHNVARAVYEASKFEIIKKKIVESYHILKGKKDLTSLLPLRAIINREQIGRR